MDWIATVIIPLITGGVGVTIGTIYTARKNSEVGMSGNEVEAAKATTADWTAMTNYMTGVVKRQDEKLLELENIITTLKRDRSGDLSYINQLTHHINMGFGPPVPERKE